jgi:hypothetical protein
MGIPALFIPMTDLCSVAAMGWESTVPPIIAAGAALLGVRYGAKSTESREVSNWARDQRMKAYIDLFDAVTNTYNAFSLVCSSLRLADYKLSEKLAADLDVLMREWGKWDQKIDEHLPRAELVASRGFQVFLSVGIRLGMRSQHRLLLMQLGAGMPLNQSEWQRVARLTLDDLEKFRQGIRADVLQKDIRPTVRRSLIDFARRLRRNRHSRSPVQ